MNVTVILCTYNRAHELTAALESLGRQIMPESDTFEVVVVDNNSSDRTREVVQKFCEANRGHFRYHFEARQGLSRARNAGIDQAKGEVIAFIDDDVIADPNWLQNLTACFRDPQWSGAGGRILPPLELDLPDWLTVGGPRDLLGVLLPVFDLGEKPIAMARAPYGTNMAFRKRMFDQYGVFRVDLGHCGKSLLSGEDVEFGNRLMAAGERLRYEPSAVIHHPVPAERLRKSHFRTWWFDYGRTRIIQRALDSAAYGRGRQLLSLASLLIRFLPVRFVRWLFAFQVQRRFYNECELWMTLGEIAQTWKFGFNSKSVPRRLRTETSLPL